MEKVFEPKDIYSPAKIAKKVESLGVSKTHIDTTTLLVLSILAGAFISLGAIFFITTITASNLGFGLTRLIGGISFCLGLILVVIAGAELFTGNNLIAMAWVSKLIKTKDVIRNWILVYIGNVIGCIGTVILLLLSDIDTLNNNAIAKSAINIANSKANLNFTVAFIRGVVCNVLVCLAVWLAMSGRSTIDKILAIIFPITAFVALGMEHSIANWFFLPYGLLLDTQNTISVVGSINNVIAVTLGNIVGGTFMVGGAYWLAYLKPKKVQENIKKT